MYTYCSDSLVHEPGIHNSTNWVTEEEYPHCFILKLINGSEYSYSSPQAISEGLNKIENTSISSVSFDSFNGMMGFYLNIADPTWGHGQYLYYPRLSNASLPSFPLYSIFPHLYVNTGTTFLDRILSDRSLYFIPSQNPRNTLQFFQLNNTWGIKYSTPSLSLFGSSWNLVHGFKYNFTDGLFHMINEIECLSHDFSDVGFAYEVTSTPQTEGTALVPTHFLLANETHHITKSISTVWDANTYLTDFLPQVELISENEQSHIGFTFADMERAGFTQKYLDVHYQVLPDGTPRKTLRFGMHGYGPYTKGSRIEIDPSPWTCNTDNWDLFRLYGDTSGWYTSNNYMRVGRFDTYEPGQGWLEVKYDCFFAFNTGILTQIGDISNITFKLYAFNNYMESGEGISSYLYNQEDDGKVVNEAGHSIPLDLGTYSYKSAVYTGTGSGWKTMDASKTEDQLDDWANCRHNSISYLYFRFRGYGVDARSLDTIDFQESSYSGTTYDPYLAFDYTASDASVNITGVITNASNNTLSGVTLDLYHEYENELLVSDTTDGYGTYSLATNISNCDDYQLYAWHTSYKTQNMSIRPNMTQVVNFTLSSESAPTCSPSAGYRNASTHNDDSGGWSSETSAYEIGTNYAYSSGNGHDLRYSGFFSENLPNLTIKGVYVYLHWRSVVNDLLRVKIYWYENGLSNSSDWISLDSQINWGLSTVNFTSVTSWIAPKINHIGFKVMIEKTANGSTEPILLDWIGIWVGYSDIRVVDIYDSYPTNKGNSHAFELKFKNVGTVTSEASLPCNATLKIQSLNYTDFYVWVNNSYSYNVEALDPGETTIFYGAKSVPSVFKGYSDPSCSTWAGWFAQNIGTYNITDVFLSGVDWNTSSSMSNELYSVTSGSEHKVFVPVIMYHELNTDIPIDHFNTIETNNNLKVLNQITEEWVNTTFKDHLSTDFILKVFESNNDTTGLNKTTRGDFLNENAGEILGLSGNWSLTEGTSDSNHGFDLLAVYFNESVTDAGNPSGGNNRIFLESWLDARATLHEVLHVYMFDIPGDIDNNLTEHLEYNHNNTVFPSPFTWNGVKWIEKEDYSLFNYTGAYIMGYKPAGAWYLHPTTEYYSLIHVAMFDGYKE